MNIKKISLLLILGVSVNANTTLNYLNKIRVNAGCAKLSYSATLAKAAKRHAIYLKTNNKYGHNEDSYEKNFYASMPWQRIVKAGFSTRAVVENITFYEPNYKLSINKIMATVYHRLAFLDTKVDTIGFANYRGVYVYDMSSIGVANLCLHSKKRGLVSNICKNPSKTLSKSSFFGVINSTKLKSAKFIIYPYKNQKNVNVKLEQEVPSFLPTYKDYGFPITVTLNSAYFRNVKLKKFKLFSNNKEINSKIVTFRNDIRKKLDRNSFVLIPSKVLAHKRSYRVVFEALANGKQVKLTWNFRTN